MLTERQQATYQFIHDYHLRRGCAPKLTEIADGIGIRSKGVVHRYLKAIAEEGLIELFPGRHRGIRMTGYPESPAMGSTLPLVGKIAAGQPIEAIPDHNMFDLSAFFLGPNRFVLKIQGDSMIDAGILEDDMIVVEQRALTRLGGILPVQHIEDRHAEGLCHCCRRRLATSPGAGGHRDYGRDRAEFAGDGHEALQDLGRQRSLGALPHEV